MKSTIFNIKQVKGVEILSKNDQKTILGQLQQQSCNLALCGCDCAGGITGPACCHFFIACLQGYFCYEEPQTS
jgi:hypothetical protein